MVLILNQMEGGEHSDAAAVVTSVVSPAASSPASASASAAVATIITSSTNTTISNGKGGDVAAVTEGGDDREVLKGVNAPEMTTAFPDEGASRAAMTEKEAHGDMSDRDVSAEEIVECFCLSLCFLKRSSLFFCSRGGILFFASCKYFLH